MDYLNPRTDAEVAGRNFRAQQTIRFNHHNLVVFIQVNSEERGPGFQRCIQCKRCITYSSALPISCARPILTNLRAEASQNTSRRSDDSIIWARHFKTAFLATLFLVFCGLPALAQTAHFGFVLSSTIVSGLNNPRGVADGQQRQRLHCRRRWQQYLEEVLPVAGLRADLIVSGLNNPQGVAAYGGRVYAPTLVATTC